MKDLTLGNLINALLFFYILSLYTLSFQAGWNILSNAIAFLLIALIWMETLMLKRKIQINKFLIIYLIFIMISLISSTYAIDPQVSIGKVQTLFLTYVLMVSLVNYINTLKKLEYAMKCIGYSGFVTSIYILLNGNYSELERFGSQLGNVNAIGLMIAIATVFLLFVFLKTRNYGYIFFILTNLVVIFLTGSRKSVVFVAAAIAILLIFQDNSGHFRRKFKYLLISSGVIVTIFYTVYSVPLFYEIIGIRMNDLITLLLSGSSTDSSINIRAAMILLGWTWFLRQPFWGYGIDNYRILYGAFTGDDMYAHNNIIELLVGVGIIGATIYYLSNIIVIVEIAKASQIISKTLCYSFIAIILGYMFMSVGLVYYDGKLISIILAIGSAIYKIAQTEKIIHAPEEPKF